MWFPHRHFFFRTVLRRTYLKYAPSMHIGEYIECTNANPHQVFRAAFIGALNATFNNHIFIYYDPAMYMMQNVISRMNIPESSFYLRVHSYNPEEDTNYNGLSGKDNHYRYYEFRYRTGTGTPFVMRRERAITKRFASEKTFERYLQKQAMKMYCVYLRNAPFYTHFVSANERLVHEYIKNTLKSDRAEFLINTKEEL